MTTLSILVAALVLPYCPLAAIFGFVKLPVSFLLLIGLIVAVYIITTEIVKKVFYKLVKF
jgi:Mg2+-importing ATPase